MTYTATNSRGERFEVGDIVKLMPAEGSKDADDRGRKAEIIFICPDTRPLHWHPFEDCNCAFRPLYKIRALSGIVGRSKVEVTWWTDEDDMELVRSASKSPSSSCVITS